MADRIFAIIALAVIAVYGYIAFAVIEAPFQYDPLGPESWPQILSVVAAISAVFVLLRPTTSSIHLNRLVGGRIAVVIVLLSAYTASFEPLGFIIATILFCTLFSLVLGAQITKAIYFGIATGVLGYGLCSGLLDLNLPAGLLSFIL
jgi:putative tricarboxylic transport membrane protein